MRKPLTWIAISRDALKQNYHALLSVLPPRTLLMPVLKSNAYGHGILPVAKSLPKTRRWGFVVVEPDEAFLLRRVHPRERMLLLSNFDPADIPECAARQIDFGLYAESQLAALRRAPHARVHVEVDTGTTRTGFRPDVLPTLRKKIAALPRVHVAGVYSHFADSEAPGSAFTQAQIRVFRTALATFPEAPFRHIACSAAALRYPDALFDAARPGIALYGLWPSATTQRQASRVHLQPVLEWKTTIIQVKAVPKGTTVGYGRTYTVKRKGKVAVLPVGYADGFPRILSGRAHVLIRGRRLPVIGRICMNVMMVDVTGATGVQAGDEAVLLGTQGKERITAEELAEQSGTINYEVTTRIRESLPRILV